METSENIENIQVNAMFANKLINRDILITEIQADTTINAVKQQIKKNLKLKMKNENILD